MVLGRSAPTVRGRLSPFRHLLPRLPLSACGNASSAPATFLMGDMLSSSVLGLGNLDWDEGTHL